MNDKYLISHWSYSALKDFSANRYKFLLTYVLKTYKFKTGVSGFVGKAVHKALELYFKTGGDVDKAVAHGLAYMNATSDDDVKWGKTGTREDALKTYTFTINAFLAEIPVGGKVLMVEEPLTEFIQPIPEISSLEGANFGIPLKCVPDRVIENAQGEIEIDDWKSVAAFSDPEIDSPERIMQALCCFHPVMAKLGKRPKRMRFWECKTSKNRDGSPQVKCFTFEFDSPEMLPYFSTFYRIYDVCSVEIAKPDVVFIPNFADMFDGEETFKVFAGETIGVERPKAVAHKLAEAEIREYNYVPSASDMADNKFITEEEKIRMKLQEFGMAVEMRNTYKGNTVIKYTMKPSRAKRMSEFAKLDKDIAIALKASHVRIEAPILGTDLVGIEVPNPERTFVKLPEEMEPFTDTPGQLIVPMGLDVYDKVVLKNLADAPHMLVAGTTGSGKSVFINVLIQALIRQNSPEQMKLVLIDPKRVELSQYKDDPHLLAKPICEIADAIKTLIWLTEEMEERYRTLERTGARNIDEYNQNNVTMPRIVVVIDEFADLMLQTKATKAKGEPNMAETAIVRLAQKARAVGIHVVLGTQRPSTDVVTGLIKANFPTRVAFATAQEVDSRIILDQAGAESLLGKGDMLLLDPSRRDLIRLQSFYV